MKYIPLMMSCLLISCFENPTFKRKLIPFTDDEKKVYAGFSLEEKVFFDNCIRVNSSYTHSFREVYFVECLRSVREEYKDCSHHSTGDSGTSILKTAVGTAVGYGAIKMLTGRRRRK